MQLRWHCEFNKVRNYADNDKDREVNKIEYNINKEDDDDGNNDNRRERTDVEDLEENENKRTRIDIKNCAHTISNIKRYLAFCLTVSIVLVPNI